MNIFYYAAFAFLGISCGNLLQAYDGEGNDNNGLYYSSVSSNNITYEDSTAPESCQNNSNTSSQLGYIDNNNALNNPYLGSSISFDGRRLLLTGQVVQRVLGDRFDNIKKIILSKNTVLGFSGTGNKLLVDFFGDFVRMGGNALGEIFGVNNHALNIILLKKDSSINWQANNNM